MTTYLDAGRNPFGHCHEGHRFFRGGCPACAADMVSDEALAPMPEQEKNDDHH